MTAIIRQRWRPWRKIFNSDENSNYAVLFAFSNLPIEGLPIRWRSFAWTRIARFFSVFRNSFISQTSVDSCREIHLFKALFCCSYNPLNRSPPEVVWWNGLNMLNANGVTGTCLAELRGFSMEQAISSFKSADYVTLFGIFGREDHPLTAAFETSKRQTHYPHDIIG